MDYYIQDGDHTVGPFELGELHQQGITPGTQVKSDKHTDWVSAESLPELQDLWLSAQAPLLPVVPTAIAVTPAVSVNLPWNPLWIAWAGLLFTPFWAGLMAAFNEQRLGTLKSIAAPLGIAGLWLFVDLVVFPWMGWGLLATLIFLAISAWVLWALVLEDQMSKYKQVQAIETSERYLLPALAGVPAFMLVCATLYSVVTAPADPLQVSRQLLVAAPKERPQYATPKMRTLLEQADRMIEAGGSFKIELSSDSDGLFALPPNKYFIPIKLTSKKPSALEKPISGEVYLQLLLDEQGNYLVDDMIDISESSLNTPIMTSFYDHREELFKYAPVLSSTPKLFTAKAPTKPQSKVFPYAYPTAIAVKSVWPTIGKIIAALVVGSIALTKGFFSVGKKREESA